MGNFERKENAMSNIGNVLSFIGNTKHTIEIFGAGKEFLNNYNTQLLKVGEVICKERRISKEQALNLPKSTPLGPDAEKEFELLKNLVAFT